MFFKKNKTNKDYLLNLKPRTEGVLKFENYEVRYPDPQSIYYEYQDAGLSFSSSRSMRFNLNSNGKLK